MVDINRMNLNELLKLEDGTTNPTLLKEISKRVDYLLKMADRYFLLTGEIMEGVGI